MHGQLIQNRSPLTGMKPTKDKVFMDSNIIIHCYSNNEIVKQAKARQLVAENNSYISAQVLQELAHNAIRKLNFTLAKTQQGIEESCRNNVVYMNNEATVLQACRIAYQYFFHFMTALLFHQHWRQAATFFIRRT